MHSRGPNRVPLVEHRGRQHVSRWGINECCESDSTCKSICEWLKTAIETAMMGLGSNNTPESVRPLTFADPTHIYSEPSGHVASEDFRGTTLTWYPNNARGEAGRPIRGQITSVTLLNWHCTN